MTKCSGSVNSEGNGKLSSNNLNDGLGKIICGKATGRTEAASVSVTVKFRAVVHCEANAKKQVLASRMKSWLLGPDCLTGLQN